jgi:enamine deaminase RidA (YjgF/YER057c/UK114 family)
VSFPAAFVRFSSPAFRGRGGTQAEGLGGEGLAESGLQTLTSHRFAMGPSSPAKGGRGRKLALILSVAAAIVPAAAAGAGERERSTVLMSEDEGSRKSQEEWGYNDAIVAGDTIYLSGIVVGQREGETLEAAYDRTYRRIGAILVRAGASWDDVVDITSFHTDVVAQMPAIVATHKKYVKAPYPAWTAIDVDRLIPERGITEIKVVARRPAERSGK